MYQVRRTLCFPTDVFVDVKAASFDEVAGALLADCLLSQWSYSDSLGVELISECVTFSNIIRECECSQKSPSASAALHHSGPLVCV